MRWLVDKNHWEWHTWYAWYPVRVGKHYVWLETLQRKRVTDRWDDWWEYL